MYVLNDNRRKMRKDSRYYKNRYVHAYMHSTVIFNYDKNPQILSPPMGCLAEFR